MPAQYYRDAQRLATKERRNCITYGQYPYLPVLDDILPAEKSAGGTDLGLVQVPAQFIVGTKTAMRTTAFARNFMPLLPENSEFAGKWIRLCQSHLEEGIRDPVTLYEYMNRYYVAEGNKRVSVLKYFDAVSIPAKVTRILPERNGDQDVELYYEFVDFSRYSGINFFELTKPGGFAELQRLMGKAPEVAWTEDERKNFATTYYQFQQAYEANGGKRLTTTVGDAMLAYIRVYGYQALQGKSDGEMKRSVAKVWEEITLQQEAQPIALNLAPEDKKKTGLLSMVLPSGGPKELKVAFVNDKTPAASGWTLAHELGRLHVQQVFRGQIVTKAYHDALSGDLEQVIGQAIDEGNKVIFTTSPRMLPGSLRVAVEHPEIAILNCSLNKSHRYIRTYYARMYDSKFLMGAIAAAMCRSDKLGYVADYPIYGTLANVNAFAMGARMINPEVKVYLEWSRLKDQDARKNLENEGIRYISGDDMITPEHASREYGLYVKREDGTVDNLAMPVWHWGKFYERIIRNICRGTDEADSLKGKKAVNYWWGMSADVIDVICAQDIPHGTHRLIDFLKSAIRAGSFHPFDGLIYSQNGVVQCKEGESLGPLEIITMNWLAENVEGRLPEYEELTEEAQALVRLQGIHVDESEKTED